MSVWTVESIIGSIEALWTFLISNSKLKTHDFKWKKKKQNERGQSDQYFITSDDTLIRWNMKAWFIGYDIDSIDFVLCE